MAIAARFFVRIGRVFHLLYALCKFYFAFVQSGIPIWKEAPFARLVIPFIAGILAQYYTGNPVEIAYVLLAASIITWAWHGSKPVSRRFINYHWLGSSLHLALFSAGSLVCFYNNPFAVLLRATKLTNTSELYVVTLTTPALERKSSWKAEASIDVIKTTTGLHDPQTKLLVYFRKKDSVYRPPPYGSRLTFSKQVQRIQNFSGLDGFDYVRYCALKNLHYQVFLAPHDYVVLPGERSSRLWSFIFDLQEWTVRTLKTYVTDDKACGLALALLIGYKNNLDRDVVKAYINAGVIHVIAISGLHLGIIYSILQFGCGLLGKKRAAKLASPVIVITGLWLFSLLAGASPSVLRSAVMFTCIVLGRTGARATSLINNLAASAFFLLCYDPFWIFDLGFQLSYGALLSIALFAKPLYNAAGDLSWIGDFLWKINSVTIAAQILTTPIIIYQFGQFPNFFLLTNFVAVPASTVILIGEILLCALSFSPSICLVLGRGITFGINYLNQVIQFIEGLPFASSSGLYINFFQLMLCYLIIIFMSSWLKMNKKKHLLAALATAILLFSVPLLKIWW